MSRGLDLEDLRRLFLTYPGVEEGISYGTPAFRVRGKLLARMWEDGEVLVLKVGSETRELLMEARPKVYFSTDHYDGSGYVLVRLPKENAAALTELFEETWRANAPKRLVASHDA